MDVVNLLGIAGGQLWPRACHALASPGPHSLVTFVGSFRQPDQTVLGEQGQSGIDIVIARCFKNRPHDLRWLHGGMVSQILIVNTSPATRSDRDLPPPMPEFRRFVATAEADWSNPASVIDYLVGYSRILAGGERAFDEARVRELVRRDVERARDIAAAQNHELMSHGEGSPKPLSSITAPTLVIHGTADPMFPLEHGEALAADIPGARLLTLDGAGHGLYRDDWEMIVATILEHTAAAEGARR